jgi:IS1 family transposase
MLSGSPKEGRLLGLHKGTLLKLLVEAGERVERFMTAAIRGVAIEDVECDEVWGFIARKEKTKRRKRSSGSHQSDSYLRIGLHRRSKLVLAHHVSRWTNQAANAFAEKLDRATGGRFQISTDSFEPYVDSLNFHLGTRTSHGMIHKEFGYEEEGGRRYSPPRLIGAEKATSYGEPDYDRIGTSYVERWNLSLRTGMKRMTRLTIAFSRCWRNHKAALALWIGYYNFVVSNRAVKMPPAMAAGLTSRPLPMRDLLEAAS